MNRFSSCDGGSDYADDLCSRAEAIEEATSDPHEGDAMNNDEPECCTCLSISRDPLCVFHGDADKLKSSELRYALVKIRSHTSYVNPTLELLQGLLASIERIADAALKET